MAVRVNSLPPLPDMLQTLGAISGQLFSQSIRQTCYRLYRVRRCHYPHVNDARGSQTQLVDEPYRGLVYQLTTQTGVVHRWGHTPFSLARNCSRIERGLHGSATFFPCRRFDTPLMPHGPLSKLPLPTTAVKSISITPSGLPSVTIRV